MTKGVDGLSAAHSFVHDGRIFVSALQIAPAFLLRSSIQSRMNRSSNSYSFSSFLMAIRLSKYSEPSNFLPWVSGNFVYALPVAALSFEMIVVKSSSSSGLQLQTSEITANGHRSVSSYGKESESLAASVVPSAGAVLSASFCCPQIAAP